VTVNETARDRDREMIDNEAGLMIVRNRSEKVTFN
jgi:hypothetical protein